MNKKKRLHITNDVAKRLNFSVLLNDFLKHGINEISKTLDIRLDKAPFSTSKFTHRWAGDYIISPVYGERRSFRRLKRSHQKGYIGALDGKVILNGNVVKFELGEFDWMSIRNVPFVYVIHNENTGSLTLYVQTKKVPLQQYDMDDSRLKTEYFRIDKKYDGNYSEMADDLWEISILEYENVPMEYITEKEFDKEVFKINT